MFERLDYLVRSGFIRVKLGVLMYGQKCMCTYTHALPCELFVDKSSTLTATWEWLILDTILCQGGIYTYTSYLLYSCASLLFESMTAHGNV